MKRLAPLALAVVIAPGCRCGSSSSAPAPIASSATVDVDAGATPTRPVVLDVARDLDACAGLLRRHREGESLLVTFFVGGEGLRLRRGSPARGQIQMHIGGSGGRIHGADRSLVAKVGVFDVYRGQGLPEAAKSIAIHVTLQPRERTLTDADIDAAVSKIVSEVSRKTGATLRS